MAIICLKAVLNRDVFWNWELSKPHMESGHRTEMIFLFNVLFRLNYIQPPKHEIPTLGKELGLEVRVKSTLQGYHQRVVLLWNKE